MRYIYKTINRTKETIQKMFDKDEENYKNIFTIIDRICICQLHHRVRHYLNPKFFYKNPSIYKLYSGYINAMQDWFAAFKFKTISQMSYHEC